MCGCSPFSIEFVVVPVEERIKDLENFNTIDYKLSKDCKINYIISKYNKSKRIRLF